MTASITIIVPQYFLGILAFYDTSYHIQRWHTFLLYQALHTINLIYNLFALRRAPWTYNIGCL